MESIDYETGEIKMASPHRYGIGGPSGGLFYAINVPEILDEPYEYYFDRETGTIRMILPEKVPDNPVIQIGYKDFTLIDIQNCRNVRIEGIEFTVHNGLAIQVTYSDSVIIQSCDLNRLAQSAVEIFGGMNCGVSDSRINIIGATGVRLEGGNRESLTPAGHFVTKSTISDFARHIKTYAPAVSLQGVGHIVSHNKIADAPHNAILFSGNDHLIEKNDIRRVCWDTSDAGAIYCGRDWTMGGTVIKNNSFFNLGQAIHHHNWAIYLDDLASGIVVLNNYINDCPSGILVGGGRYNRIIGNEITNCPKASIMYDARGLNWYIPYIEDPDNELWQRLSAVPIEKSPWKDRFPWLMDISDDEPGIPKYVTILDNIIINSADPSIHSTVNEFGNVRFD
ncbi:right-handed parallel beta-helix repeat-containing protein [Bacteroidota bacterium]